MRFDINLSLLFTELPLRERPRAAAEVGFDTIELWWPFDGPLPGDAEIEQLVAAVDDAGVGVVSLNFDAGDMAAGDRGLVSHPAAVKRFRANVEVAVGIAERLGCRVLNALYGNRLEGTHAATQDETAVENLGIAAAAAAHIDATVVLEPLNRLDNPRYPVVNLDDAAAVASRVAEQTRQRVGLLADLYHLQRGQGNLLETVSACLDEVVHVQIADCPGRHEPGTGEIAFERLLPALDEAGYRGYVGLEYVPRGATVDSFGWLEAFHAR